MKSVRQYAKEYGIKVVGKLNRKKKWEYTTDPETGKKKRLDIKVYVDEVGNEFYLTDKGCTICTFDGAVI